MNSFRQCLAVSGINLRNLPHRTGNSSVIVVGIAAVVGVLIAILAIAVGVNRTFGDTGRTDRAIILRDGASSETASVLTRENVVAIMNARNIARDQTGAPQASPENVAAVELRRRGSSDLAPDTGPVTLRGISLGASSLGGDLHLAAGRMFSPALHEVVVGASAAAQFAGLAVGDRIKSRNIEWTVVGELAHRGDAHDSELLTDGETLNSAFGRNYFQSVTAQLERPEAIEALRSELAANPTLSVDVSSEKDYYAKQAKRITGTVFVSAYLVAGIMAVGAIFGAINTMYSAVAARTTEIATLRALGFHSGAVAASVIAEALALSLLGGCVGAALVWCVLNGNTVSTLGSSTGQVVFHLDVSLGLAVLGIIWAIAIGAVGGVAASIRATRVPLAAALNGR
jgi:putative ABC transport system permease protein